MSKVMIIGCGGVASVAIHKCCQNSEVFSEIMIASRTLSKCDALKRKAGSDHKNDYHNSKGGCRLHGRINRLNQTVSAGRCVEPGSSLSGSYHYGCLPCM